MVCLFLCLHNYFELFNIINVFQTVFSYAFFQKDSARGTWGGFHEFHLGASGKSHDVHVGPL